eukprot:15431811-Alexandrium_andersonii.AAC.1
MDRAFDKLVDEGNGDLPHYSGARAPAGRACGAALHSGRHSSASPGATGATTMPPRDRGDEGAGTKEAGSLREDESSQASAARPASAARQE